MAVARSRTIVIAGAGIGGLTAALALASKGFRVVILEQAARLEETGAGLQLSPNATRILCALGLKERLTSFVVAPEVLRIMSGVRAREIVRMPLGRTAEARYGAPYWVIHRAELQGVLLAAVRANPDITLRLGAHAEDYAVHANGLTVHVRVGARTTDEYGIAFVGADGLWSTLRTRLGEQRPPRPARRTAWRATVPADLVGPEFRAPMTTLWLGPRTHLVHYPVTSGIAINIVAIVRDDWQGPGWSTVGKREELLARFARWAPLPRTLLTRPDRWLKWALYDRAPLRAWGRGPVTLLGDAAHPMLPFLAQGAAMAIEDAYVLAECLAATPDDPEPAMRRYESLRVRRTAQVQRAAASNGRLYHMGSLTAAVRNFTLRKIGGPGLLRRYDWLYNWRP